MPYGISVQLSVLEADFLLNNRLADKCVIVYMYSSGSIGMLWEREEVMTCIQRGVGGYEI